MLCMRESVAGWEAPVIGFGGSDWGPHRLIDRARDLPHTAR